MKTIILMRHAKSSWKYPELKDIDRPLKKKGEKDSVMMAQVLKESALPVDGIVSSPAVRAKATASAVAGELGISSSSVVENPRIYLESKNKLLHEINALDDRWNTVVMVAHNPALTDLANMLNGKSFDRMPTASVIAIQFDCNSWKEVEKKNGKSLFFESPKKRKKKIEKTESKVL
jgi:phosphohistidine phosphatase